MELMFAAAGAYLLGSIPFALLLARALAGVDIRKIGSGNVGATNASRAFRSKPQQIGVFLAVYVLDFAKGFGPTWFAWGYFAQDHGAAVLVGAAAILGHCTSPFLGFKGGKGVATSTGVFAFLQPWVLLTALAVFFVVRALTKQVFLGSLAIGITLATGTVAMDFATAFANRWPETLLALLLAVFLFYTHRSNIRSYWKRPPQAASES